MDLVPSPWKGWLRESYVSSIAEKPRTRGCGTLSLNDQTRVTAWIVDSVPQLFSAIHLHRGPEVPHPQEGRRLATLHLDSRQRADRAPGSGGAYEASIRTRLSSG